ncbi:MAG: hypothetical protein ACREV9_13820 [Burkholderiales bacterium]
MDITHSLCAAICLAMLAGCGNTGTPRLDDSFGYAVNTAKAQQTVNPDASLNTDPVAGIDGPSADAAIDEYKNTFVTPPPPPTIINIGGGISGGAGQ